MAFITLIPLLLLLRLRRRQLTPYSYADDTQLYGFCLSTAFVSASIDKASLWLPVNCLQLTTQDGSSVVCNVHLKVVSIERLMAAAQT